jgi:hypothetical protein
MDPTQQVFATGGASSIVIGVLLLAYKYMTSPHRVRSQCCGKTLDLQTEAPDTPAQPVPQLKPTITVETDAAR